MALALFLVGMSGMLTGCGGCSLPKQYCIDEVEATPLGPPLNDRACFVGPVSGKTIPGHADALTWSNSDKQVVEAALTVAIRDKYGGSTGFGDIDEALREFGMSSDNPLLVFRKSTSGGSSASASAHLDIKPEFISFDTTQQAAVLCHEMAHYWRWHNPQGGTLYQEMIDKWINWGDTATDYGVNCGKTDCKGEDFAEAVEVYFYPQYDKNREWTDDMGAGLALANDPKYGGGGKDGLRLASNYKDFPLESRQRLSATGTKQVCDRYDYLECEFTGNCLAGCPESP